MTKYINNIWLEGSSICQLWLRACCSGLSASLFQCLTTFWVKNSILVSDLNLSTFSLKPFASPGCGRAFWALSTDCWVMFTYQKNP